MKDGFEGRSKTPEKTRRGLDAPLKARPSDHPLTGSYVPDPRDKSKRVLPARELFKSVLAAVKGHNLQELLEKSQLQVDELPKSVIRKSRLGESVAINVLLQEVYDNMVYHHMPGVTAPSHRRNDSMVMASEKVILLPKPQSTIETAPRTRRSLPTDDMPQPAGVPVLTVSKDVRRELVSRLEEVLNERVAEIDPDTEYNLTPEELKQSENKALLEEICDQLIQKVLNEEVGLPESLRMIPSARFIQQSAFPADERVPAEVEPKESQLVFSKAAGASGTDLFLPRKDSYNSKKVSQESLKSIENDRKESSNITLGMRLDSPLKLNSSGGTIRSDVCEKDREVVQKLRAENISLRQQLERESEASADSLLLIRDLQNRLQEEREARAAEIAQLMQDLATVKSDLDKKRYENENQRLNMQQLNNELKRTRAMNALLNGNKAQNEDLRKKFERTFQEKEATLKQRELELSAKLEKAEKLGFFLVRKLKEENLLRELTKRMDRLEYFKLMEANYDTMTEEQLAGFIWEDKEWRALGEEGGRPSGAANQSMDEFQTNRAQPHRNSNAFATELEDLASKSKPMMPSSPVIREESPQKHQTSHPALKFEERNQKSAQKRTEKQESEATHDNPDQPKGFGTNKEDIRKNLDTILKMKMQFKTGGNPLPPRAHRAEPVESVFTQESQLVIPSQRPMLIQSLKALVSDAAYSELISELGGYLESHRNKTTFRLTDFDRKVFRVKFDSGKEQTVRKVVMRLIKIFVRFIEHLEGKINQLLNSNSNWELKYHKLKEESEVMLHKYLETNKQTQLVLNQANEQVMRFKTNTSGAKPSMKSIINGKFGKMG